MEEGSVASDRREQEEEEDDDDEDSRRGRRRRGRRGSEDGDGGEEGEGEGEAMTEGDGDGKEGDGGGDGGARGAVSNDGCCLFVAGLSKQVGGVVGVCVCGAHVHKYTFDFGPAAHPSIPAYKRALTYTTHLN